MQDSIRVVNSILGRLSGEGTLGCRYVGQHQGCCLCPRQKVRCRGLWAVGVQDSIRVAKFVLDRLSGAGVSGLSACRTASGLLFLSWTEAQVQGSLDCRHTGQHQGCYFCAGQRVRCRDLWTVGMQDSIRVANTVLGRLSGAGDSGLSVCRTASGLLSLS